ncbi:MAG: hypothetical protein M3140_05520 [Actinomycetota bacterium]|nr:hypothetical protein [Actinomycetota bacterium]
MAPQPIPDSPAPGGDPWAAFGYIVAGVAFYGALGWGLSVWLDASYWIPIGILVGLGFGMYLVFARYRIGGSNSAGSDAQRGELNSNDAAREVRPPRDDRGDAS